MEGGPPVEVLGGWRNESFMVLSCESYQVLRHRSELMGTERRTKVIMGDENRQLEGQTKTRHRAEIPNAPEGARSTVLKNNQFEEKRIDIASEGKRRVREMRCCLF